MKWTNQLIPRINEVDEDSEEDEEEFVVTFIKHGSGYGEGSSKGLSKNPRHKGPMDMLFAHKPKDVHKGRKRGRKKR